MARKSGSGDGITIVGGRPMQRAVAAEKLPQGVEQVLTIAALEGRTEMLGAEVECCGAHSPEAQEG